MEFITTTILQATQSPWILVIVCGLVIIDGFFPPCPSETIIVAVAAVSAGTGQPSLVALVVVSALGALIGDSIAYALGTRLTAQRVRWLRGPRLSAAITRAGTGLAARPALYLLTARYIPVGRLAVNLAAGSTSLPVRQFVPLAAVAGASWAAVSVAIGLLAGSWVDGHPLLGAAIGIGAALTLGVLIELGRRTIQTARAHHLARATATERTAQAPPPTPPPHPNRPISETVDS